MFIDLSTASCPASGRLAIMSASSLVTSVSISNFPCALRIQLHVGISNSSNSSMSSYHIISDSHHDFDFFPSCNLDGSALLIRRLSIDSLKGLARMIKSFADRLEDNQDGNVRNNMKEKADILKEKQLLTQQADIIELNCQIPRDRSDSVDSGIGDWEIDPETGLEVISLEEVSYHCTREDGWIVVYDKIFEMTEYLEKSSHPGGDEVIMENLGYDATMAFRGVGHSRGVSKMLKKYLVGILPRSERLGLTPDYT